MSNYETYLEELESGEDVSEEALEAATDALAFCLAMHEALKENGYTTDEPSIEFLEKTWDGMMGELAAASLFLSENVFKNAPTMMRGIADNLSNKATDNNDVPAIVAHGFRSFAKRIEATRVQQTQMKEFLKKEAQ